MKWDVKHDRAKKVLNHYLNENGLLLNKNRSAIPLL